MVVLNRPKEITDRKGARVLSSPIEGIMREESLTVHTGVKIFLQLLAKERIFGVYLKDDLHRIHALLTEINQINGKPDFTVKDTNRISLLREQLETALDQLDVKLKRGDKLVMNLGPVLKSYLHDERSLMKLIDERLFGRTSVPDREPQKGLFWFWQRNAERWDQKDKQRRLLERFQVTKTGLQKIIPLYKEMAFKYYDFHGKMMRGLDQTKKLVLKNQSLGRVDFSNIYLEMIEVEKRLFNALSNAEEQAQQTENVGKYTMHNNYEFISVVKSMIAPESKVVR